MKNQSAESETVTFEVDEGDVAEFAECLASSGIAFCFVKVGFTVSSFDEKAVELAWFGDGD